MMRYIAWFRDRYHARVPTNCTEDEYLRLHYLEAEKLYWDFHQLMQAPPSVGRVRELEAALRKAREKIVASHRVMSAMTADECPDTAYIPLAEAIAAIDEVLNGEGQQEAACGRSAGPECSTAQTTESEK